MEAVDRIDRNLISACEESDVIMLATPLGAIQETMHAIGPHVKPGVVILDTASLKKPVLAWATEILPKHAHFIGGNPILSGPVRGKAGLEAARIDLFQNGLFCLAPTPTAEEKAVRIASNLVTLLGARPIFFDAAEHDGLLGAVEHLPKILSLALLEMAIQQPTWRELRRVASSSFEIGTDLGATDAEAHSTLALSNRDNLVRWIDTFSQSLASIRQVLVQGEPGTLADRFENALEERDKWLQDRATGHWDKDLRPELPERPGILDSFFGGLWGRNPRGDL
jgi:prephenate dehydrogenase